MSNYIINFLNATAVPINIETWQPTLFGFLSTVVTQTVKPGEQIIMSSETGEWLLNSFFIDKDMCDIWTNTTTGNAHNLGRVIGKFHNEINKYSHMCTDDFEIKYINGTATFSKKE